MKKSIKPLERKTNSERDGLSAYLAVQVLSFCSQILLHFRNGLVALRLIPLCIPELFFGFDFGLLELSDRFTVAHNIRLDRGDTILYVEKFPKEVFYDQISLVDACGKASCRLSSSDQERRPIPTSSCFISSNRSASAFCSLNCFISAAIPRFLLKLNVEFSAARSCNALSRSCSALSS